MYRKEIVYDRATRDYAMYIDDRYVGSRATKLEAERVLNNLVFELLSTYA